MSSQQQRPTSTSYTSTPSQAMPYYPSPMSSPSTVVQPMMSTSTLQSTLTTSSTLAGSTDKSKRSSFMRALGLKAAGTSSALALLPEDTTTASSSTQQRQETKQEKKERKRREQEAKLTPEERQLAQVMGRYGAGADGFGGMSMDYARKDKQKAQDKGRKV